MSNAARPAPESRNHLTSDEAGSSGRTAISLAKKRARDRRAQQNQREKRNEQVRSLQEQLTRMESRVLGLTQECEALRHENRLLRARQDSAKQLVASWDVTTTTTTSSPPSVETKNNADGSGSGVGAGTPDLEFWSRWSSFTRTPASTAPSDPSAPPGSPWINTPTHSANDIVVTECFRGWLQRPDVAQSSPDEPQPTELLYGSKTNFLANVIHQSLRSWPCRDPERLAAGWLIYNQIKWMLRPNPDNYKRLLDFQVPVAEQLDHGHPYFVDFVHWPELRAKMIQHRDAYNPQDVLGMYLCCVKLRWPWGQNFLEPEDDGTLKMRQDFFETFTRLDGWGITEDFFQRFPVFVEHLDVSAIRYRVC